MKPEEIKQLTSSLQNEINGAALYQGMAAAEKDPKIAEVYRRMAASEQRHAELLTRRLESAGVPVTQVGITWRTRTLIGLVKRFGVGIVLPSVAAFEQNDQRGYSHVSENAQLAADEASHARLLRQISRSTAGGMEGSALAQIEGRHRSAGGNALRAAVLGANDGLVSNLSLVMGVAGAALPSQSILITGLAGLLAGAFSMALGEWLSVQSSRELYQHQIAIERDEIASIPEEEVEELSLIYQARGIQPEQAKHLASQIMSDQGSALETMVREELGVDPKELGGSAWEAAIASFLLFAVGAIIPVIAFIFLEGLPAIVVSLVLSALGLFVIGGGITLFTGRGVLFSGGRQVGFGLAAAAATYLIGRLIGVNLGG
jgi:VIT1/CCC1 family predicted Fe2+/Mn2+ transporter